MLTEQFGDFFPVYDVNGNERKICKFGTSQEDADVNGMYQPQSSWYETDDGQRVEKKDAKHFRIIETGIDLTLDKPDTH